MDFNENSNYWDYISTQQQAEIYQDSLKDLVKEAFPFFKIYLDELFYIEANFIYLNLVMGISQKKIAELFGISQYGVSKRITAGMRKIKDIIKRPEVDRNIVREDLKNFFDITTFNIVVSYYFMKTFALVSEITGYSKSDVRNKTLNAVTILEELKDAETKEQFIKTIKKSHQLKKYNIKFQNKVPKYILDYISKIEQDDSFYEYEREKADRYYIYLSELVKSYNYGDYIFKAEKKETTIWNNNKLEMVMEDD